MTPLNSDRHAKSYAHLTTTLILRSFAWATIDLGCRFARHLLYHFSCNV
jgi:hypothetical protein